MAEGAERDEGSEKPRWIGMLQLGAVIAVTLLALYFMRTPKMADLSEIAARTATGPVQVQVVRPSAAQRALTVDLTGTVSLSGTIGLRPRVPGRVVWVSPNLRSGGSFSAGEPLLRIDPEDYEIAVQGAEAGVEKQRARMVIQPAKAARFKAAMEEEQARLAAARLALSRTTYSVPFDGRVVATQVVVGSMAGPGNAAGAAYPLTAIQVDAAVALADLAQLEPAVGRSAEVRVAGATLPATVERVSAGVDPRSRMATLYLKFTEAVSPDTLPLPGIFVEVSVSGRTLDDVFALQDTAERPDGGVWVVDDGVLRSASPQSFGHDRTGWIVAAFDAADGIVVGPVPGGAEGLAVEPVVQGGDGP